MVLLPLLPHTKIQIAVRSREPFLHQSGGKEHERKFQNWAGLVQYPSEKGIFPWIPPTYLTDSNQTSLQEPKLQAKTPKKREIPRERRNKQRTKRRTYPPPEKPPNQVIGRHNEQGEAPCWGPEGNGWGETGGASKESKWGERYVGIKLVERYIKQV